MGGRGEGLESGRDYKNVHLGFRNLAFLATGAKCTMFAPKKKKKKKKKIVAAAACWRKKKSPRLLDNKNQIIILQDD